MDTGARTSMAESPHKGTFSDPLKRRCVESLRQLPFLNDCKEVFLDQLAMSLESRIALAKEVVFSEGDDANELFILRRGKLEALQGSMQGDGSKTEFDDGALIGNPTALFIHQKRPFTVIASEMSELQILTRRDFQAAIVLHPNDGARVAHRLESQACSHSSKVNPGEVCHHASSARSSINVSICNMKMAAAMAEAVKQTSSAEEVEEVSAVAPARPLRRRSDGNAAPARPSIHRSGSSKRASLVRARTRDSLGSVQLPAAAQGSTGARRPSTARAFEHSNTTPGMSTTPRGTQGTTVKRASHGHADNRAKCIKSWAYSVQEDSEAARRDYAAFLDTIPFFSKMDAFFLERILHLFEKRRFKCGDHILSEGTPTDALHVVNAGTANVVLNGNVVNTVGVKSILGERVILQAGNNSQSIASVVVASPVVVTLSLPRAALHMILREDPALQKQFEEQFDVQKRERGEHTFSSLKLFQGCSEQFAKVLEMNLEQRLIAKGAMVFQEGEPSREAFLLCLGTVSVLQNLIHKHSMTAHNFADAVILGEFNLLGVTPVRQTTVVAVTECRVHVIFPDSLKKTLDHFPDESAAFRKLVEKPADLDLCDGLSESSLSTLMSESGAQQETEHAATGEGIRQSKFELCLQVSCTADLWSVSQLSGCTSAFLQILTGHLKQRLYMPEQVVMREGEEMIELHVLQLGTCTISFDGESLATVEAPCLLGSLMSLMTRKVITTVVAKKMCFVDVISKEDFAACLDDHPEDQRYLLELAHDMYKDESGVFLESIGKDLDTKLKCLPMLKEASGEFISLLARIVKPRLMLPGQIARDESEEDGSGQKELKLPGEKPPKLYILFEGYCQVIHGNSIIATLRKGAMFGELDVWELNDCSREAEKTLVKTIELCKVGVVEQGALFKLLAQFPDERLQLEKLVHNRLEEGVYARISHQPCFDGLPNQFISKLCLSLRRRLYQGEEYIANEGAQGDSMFIINRGKADIVLKGIVLGMLWAGKSFGDGQLLGVTRQYHASLRTKGACHVLELSRKSLTGLMQLGAEREWLTDWQRRAKASLDSDMKVMTRKLREHRRMLRLGLGFLEECSQVVLAGVIAAWHRATITEKVDRHVKSRCTPEVKKRFDAGIAALAPYVAHTPSQIDVEAKDYMQSAAPLRFSRGLQKIELELNAAGVTSTKAWRHWGQSGRLDRWKGTRASPWLSAVREEIPKQLMTLKAEARGASRLPGLIAPN